MTEHKAKEPKVSVWVPWGTDQCECEIAMKTWQQIVAGKEEFCSFETAYEDWLGTAYFHFNGDGYGSLHASTSDDGEEMFIGDLDEAEIVMGNKEIPWSELKRPDEPGSPRRKRALKKSPAKPKSRKRKPRRP